MPIKYETILSIYDDKLTLLQYLKKVEKALQDDGADFDTLVATLATKDELDTRITDAVRETEINCMAYTDEKIAELPTGDKLYRHVLSDFSSGFGGSITIISTRADNYNVDLNLLATDQQQGKIKSASCMGPTSISLGWFISYSMLCGFTSGGTTTYINFYRGSSAPTETITPIE